MHWLIIEDALKDKSGHWLEFIKTFRDGLNGLGDEVTIIGPRDAEQSTIATTGMLPVLPASMWRRGKSRGSRFKRALLYAQWICSSIVSILKAHKKIAPDLIFVPTVGIPHLVVWYILMTLFLRRGSQVLLYFMACPITTDSRGNYKILGITGRFFFLILKGLSHKSNSGNLILATETHSLSAALSHCSGATFHTLPQPVNRMFSVDKLNTKRSTIVLGSYGPARHEKRSHILIEAINNYLSSTKRDDIHFVVQWLDDFQLPNGQSAYIPKTLTNDQRFTRIDQYFNEGEYADWLKKTSLMLLPYGNEYALRGSRVVVEAIIHAIPCVVAEGTTLEVHALEHGSSVTSSQNNVDDLTNSIQSAIVGLDALREKAHESADSAAEHFSVEHFRHILLKSLIT